MRRLLLDTHVLLWWLADSPRLRPEVRAAVADPANEAFISPASLWEASIKRALGRLRFDDEELRSAIASGYLCEIPIAGHHALAAGSLPRHHEDPFDRMLIAQAAADGLAVVTRDRAFAPYGVPILWA